MLVMLEEEATQEQKEQLACEVIFRWIIKFDSTPLYTNISYYEM